jgi:hypothetical protein
VQYALPEHPGIFLAFFVGRRMGSLLAFYPHLAVFFAPSIGLAIPTSDEIFNPAFSPREFDFWKAVVDELPLFLCSGGDISIADV